MRGHGLKKRWLLAILIVAAILDFNGFRETTAGMKAGDVSEADALVVLTGGSGLRISAAMDLLASGVGERLLISGVNPNVSQAEVAAQAGGAPELYACCVDIGYQATTTLENAEEVAAWVDEHDYAHIVLVTSSYHMPRARFVLEEAAEDVMFVPYPVTTRIDPARAYHDWRSLRGTVQEWLKWRVTQVLSLVN
ncbi:MAG: YdcF family protein [Hyphomonadaceae bacterium]|nr:YdcF family protein [Hyphomonadaceae bacterium]